jgi:hypothetical protein
MKFRNKLVILSLCYLAITMLLTYLFSQVNAKTVIQTVGNAIWNSVNYVVVTFMLNVVFYACIFFFIQKKPVIFLLPILNFGLFIIFFSVVTAVISEQQDLPLNLFLYYIGFSYAVPAILIAWVYLFFSNRTNKIRISTETPSI